MASDKIARAMAIQNGLEITEKIGELSSEIDSNNSVIVETDKYITSLGNTKDGLLSVNSIKGNTVQNIFPVLSSYKFTTSTGLHYTYSDNISLMKPNTVYTYILVNLPSGIDTIYLGNSASTFVLIPKTKTNTGNVYKFTSPSTIVITQLAPHFYHSTEKTPSDFANTKFMILEGDWTNKEIPKYFEGIKSVGEDTGKLSVKSVGKNLWNFPLTQPKTINGVTLTKTDDTYVLNGTCISSSLFIGFSSFTLKEGTYILSANNPMHNNHENALIQIYSPTNKYSVVAKDNSVNSVSAPTRIPESNDYEYRIRIESGKTYNNFTIKPQLEMANVVTLYEPYQESKLEIPLSEPLRSLPNGVKDEIVNGKLIRRVGKVVLNGKESYAGPSASSNVQVNTTLFWVANTHAIVNNTLKSTSTLLSDKMPSVGLNDDVQGVIKNTLGGSDSKLIFFRIEKSKLSSNDSTGAKAYLTANPMTIYYELETPTETMITPPIQTVKAYQNGTMIIENNITPTLNVNTTSSVSNKVYNIETELVKAVNSNTNAWQTLMILADKELRMKSLTLLTTETATDLKNKINEMINIWRS